MGSRQRFYVASLLCARQVRQDLTLRRRPMRRQAASVLGRAQGLDIDMKDNAAVSQLRHTITTPRSGAALNRTLRSWLHPLALAAPRSCERSHVGVDMARIIGGIAASHTPTIGFAYDRDRS